MRRFQQGHQPQKIRHRRGASQQMPRTSRNKDKDRDKEIIDLKQNYALSSEHTRSTALTYYKNKQKQKYRQRQKIANKQKQKQKQNPSIQKQPHKAKYQQLQNLFDNKPIWRQQNAPYSPQQVLKIYGSLLDPVQRSQIRQYRNIYYIGNKGKKKDKIKDKDKDAKQQNCQKNKCKINNYMHNQRQNQKQSEQSFLAVSPGDHIGFRYELISLLNTGSFGQVYKAIDHKTHQLQALKISKKTPQLLKQIFIQISILTAIKQKDKNNISGIVRIKDFIIYRQHICIAFQLLDANLYELLSANQFRGLGEDFVRIFAIQVLNSLNFLYRMGVVHCDIKPENLVLKEWGKSGIKLIDFGTSCYTENQIYTYIQSRYYRSPQIIFQRSYTPAIDMWSFGCLIAELALGKPLFPGHSDLQHLLYIIALLGYPEEEFSSRCSGYLQREGGKVTKRAIERFESENKQKIEEDCLKPLQDRFPGQMFAFVHFIKQILKWNPKDRITPAQALQHPWITNGLPSQIRDLYTIYQKLDKRDSKQDQISHKKSKGKSKSKSKSKSIQKQKNAFASISKVSPIGLHKDLPEQLIMGSISIQHKKRDKNNRQQMKGSKNLKFELPYSLNSINIKSKIAKKSQQKDKEKSSRYEKSNKSPNSNSNSNSNSNPKNSKKTRN